MTYLAWATFYEGPSDGYYFDVLLPRLIGDIVVSRGIGNADVPDTPAIVLGNRGREIALVASEGCEAREAFRLLFIHADSGGRSTERSLASRSDAICEAMLKKCAWPKPRCVTLTPRHETEAWLLADPDAVLSALGYNGSASELGLPTSAREAEKLGDPKSILRSAIAEVSGRRRPLHRPEDFYPAIAQRQRLALLRLAPSFRKFEAKLLVCLSSLGAIRLASR